MKQLLAQTGITYFSVLAVAFYVSVTATVIIGAVGLIAGIVLLCIEKTRRTVFIPAMAFAAALACIVNIGYTFIFVTPVTEKYAYSEHEIEATLIEEPYKAYSMHYYRLRVNEIDGEEASFDLLLKTGRVLDVDVDDTMYFSAPVEKVQNNYYISKGCYLMSDVYTLSYDAQEAESHTLYYHAVRLRKKLRIAFDRLLPHDCASLCKAVFIGDKYALDLDIRDSFRFAGASYFIVISGMHFAILCLLLYRLLRRANRWLRFCVLMVFIAVYMAVTGFQPSVMRSGVMMAVFVFGNTIYRQTFSLNHLGFAGFLLPLLMSPYAAGDVGLILSFYATMSILLWADPLSKKLCRTDEFDNIIHADYTAFFKRGCEQKPTARLIRTDIYNRFAMILSVGLAANILVFPISVFIFGAFSLVTLLSSVLLYLAIYCIVVLSLFMSVVFLIMPLRFIAVIISYPLLWLCRYVLWVVGGLGSLPFAYVKVNFPAFYVWLCLTILLGIWVLIPRNGYKRLPKAAAISAVLLAAAVVTNTIISVSTLRLEVYDCGKGICAGVNSGGRLYLVSMDAESREFYSVLNTLSSKYGGAQVVLCKNERQAEKLSNYSSGEFAFSDYLLYDSDADVGGRVISFEDNSTFLLDDDLTLRVVMSGKRAVPLIEAGDRRILIIPPKAEIGDIPEPWLDADTVVMSEIIDEADDLSGADLVISDLPDAAEKTADALGDGFDNLFLTYQGDVYIDLR